MKQYLVLSALAIQLLSSCGSNSKENGLALGEKKAALEKLKSQKTTGIPRLPANHILLTNRTVVGVDWGAWVGKNQKENTEMLLAVLAEIAAGKLHPVEPVTYPMSQAVQAMRDLQNRKIAGKVALTPQFD